MTIIIQGIYCRNQHVRETMVDTVSSLSSEHHVRRIVKKVKCMLVNTKLPSSTWTFSAYIGPRVKNAAQVQAPYLRRH